MSMAREEAIKILQYRRNIVSNADAEWCVNETIALDLALSALRPVSREQVEKVFLGCDYCKHAWMEGLDLKPCASGNIGVELTIGRVSEDDAFGILAYYRNAAAGYIDFPFCPFCGRPMTDEAVQMVMERLEALNDADTNS